MLNDVALSIIKKRYLQEGEEPEDLFERVARAVAEAEPDDMKEELYRAFLKMMVNLDFLPNSPTLMNAGRPMGQLSACFVLPLEDSMEGIFKTLHDMAMVQRSGGGCGFNFGALRPKGSKVSTTHGASSGPVSFMRVFNAASNEIEQGGMRRGANMGCMSVYHPDIKEFIQCKSEEGTFTNFNISVLIDKPFLEAVEDGSTIELYFGNKVYETVKAREIFDLICEYAHRNGEPGVIFIDTINKKHPLKYSGEISATNPCGEQPLLPYEACNLGSINLANFYNPDMLYSFDWDRFKKVVILAVRFLDDVITINKYPIKEIEEMVKKTRKIGLGVMGWATLLQKMKLSYGSPDSLHLAKVIMETISHVGREASDVIGEERGSCVDGDEPMFTRNATITTIAPTGTLATIAGVSYGVEPIFALKYQKKMVDEYHDMVDNQFIADLKKHVDGIEASDIIEEVVKTGSCQHIQSIPQQMRNIYRTASEIPWGEHVETQAAFQAYTDNAVSKTINLPEKTTKEEIGELILHAYKRGCKGLTIYRNNSRKNEAVSIGTKQEPLGQWLNIKPLKRPDKLYGFTERIETGCGKLYVTINFDEQGHPFEVFAETDGGGCEAFSEGVSRMISLSLRSGVDVDEIIEQLRSVKCTNFIRKAASGKIKGKSCPDVIGRALSEAVNVQMPIINNVVENIVEEERGGTVCPNCGKHMDYAEGCWSCSCGYSKCS